MSKKQPEYTDKEVNEIIALLMSRDEEDFILANNMMEVMKVELPDSIMEAMNEESLEFNFYRGHLYNLVRYKAGIYKQIRKSGKIYHKKVDISMIEKAIAEIYGYNEHGSNNRSSQK